VLGKTVGESIEVATPGRDVLPPLVRRVVLVLVLVVVLESGHAE
jgi:hypothetical protein